MDHRKRWFRGNGRLERMFREEMFKSRTIKLIMSNKKSTAAHRRCNRVKTGDLTAWVFA